MTDTHILYVVVVVVVVIVVIPAVDVEHGQIDDHLGVILSRAQNLLRVNHDAAPHAVAEAYPTMHHAPVALVRPCGQVNEYELVHLYMLGSLTCFLLTI